MIAGDRVRLIYADTYHGGSERGGRSAAIAYTLIETAKLNGVDPQGWLTVALGGTSDRRIMRLDELFPWRYAQT